MTDSDYSYINDIFRNTLKYAIGKTPYKLPDNLIKHYVDSKMDIHDYIKMYKTPFVIPNFRTLAEKDDYFRWRCEMIRIPKKYEKVWEQYKLIESQPQHEQKSAGWFADRERFITASAGADAIDESKYNTSDDLLLNKVGLGVPFKENMHVYHGKKLETIATLIYSHINNVCVGEFGLIPHLNGVPFLGASPDGICSCMSLDGNFSKLVGVMLEIKCVTFRKINITGPEHVYTLEKPDPGIIPHYYWIQIQLQLECCDLEICAFWQTKIKDYWSERLLNEGIAKCKKTEHTIEQGIPVNIDPRLEYGTFIELMPKDVSKVPSDEKPEWYAKFIYPVRLDLKMPEKIEWAQYMKNNWQKHYPQFVEDYKFGKILYYHLEKSHCYTVYRDKSWFNEKLPLFKKFWNRVLEIRNNPEKKQQLINKISENLMKIEKAKKADIKRTKFVSMDSDSD
jgi:putative phage-type endonuclease